MFFQLLNDNSYHFWKNLRTSDLLDCPSFPLFRGIFQPIASGGRLSFLPPKNRKSPGNIWRFLLEVQYVSTYKQWWYSCRLFQVKINKKSPITLDNSTECFQFGPTQPILCNRQSLSGKCALTNSFEMAHPHPAFLPVAPPVFASAEVNAWFLSWITIPHVISFTLFVNYRRNEDSQRFGRSLATWGLQEPTEPSSLKSFRVFGQPTSMTLKK